MENDYLVRMGFFMGIMKNSAARMNWWLPSTVRTRDSTKLCTLERLIPGYMNLTRQQCGAGLHKSGKGVPVVKGTRPLLSSGLGADGSGWRWRRARQASSFLQGMMVSKTSNQCPGLPRGSVVKNPPANAGDSSSIPDPGRFHILEQLSPCTTTAEPAL